MRNTIYIVAACIGLVVQFFPSAAIRSAEQTSNRSSLTVTRIFGKKEFETQQWGPVYWLEDGSAYTTLEASQTLKGAKDVVRYDAESGSARS